MSAVLLYPYHMFGCIFVNKSCWFLFPIQASSPLQVKYADGELERLGVL